MQHKGLLTVFAIAAATATALLFFPFIAKSDATATAPMQLAADGHYTTPVMVNGEGPFAFIVDTGAQRSVITSGLAAKLKLMQIPGARVKATSGVGAGGISILKSYSSALFSRFGELMVVLPEGGVVKEGVLGMDLFSSRRLELNFAAKMLSSANSGPTPSSFIAIPATVVQGSFIVTDVTVDGVPAKAMIDTGARRTLANSLLRTALGLRDGDPRLSAAEPVGGATADTTKAVMARLGALHLGKQRFDRPVLTFSDIPQLQSLGLSDTPAMVIGLDILGNLRAVAIDYPRQELQLKP